jgi:hypothetical protein
VAASFRSSWRNAVEEVRRLPPVHEVAYLRLDGFPVDDPEWDVGVEEVLAIPYYPWYDLESAPIDFAVTYDRVPKDEVEIRRAGAVDSADGQHLGNVDGFLVDEWTRWQRCRRRGSALAAAGRASTPAG